MRGINSESVELIYLDPPFNSNANYAAPIGLQDLTHPVTLGTILGLLLDNPIGILLFTGLGVRLRVTRLPEGVNWLHMTGRLDHLWNWIHDELVYLWARI